MNNELLRELASNNALPTCPHMSPKEFLEEVLSCSSKFRWMPWMPFTGKNRLSPFQVAALAQEFWLCHPYFIRARCEHCVDLNSFLDPPEETKRFSDIGDSWYYSSNSQYYGIWYYVFVGFIFVCLFGAIFGYFLSLNIGLTMTGLFILVLLFRIFILRDEEVGRRLMTRMAKAMAIRQRLYVLANIAAAYTSNRISIDWLMGPTRPPGLPSNIGRGLDFGAGHILVPEYDFQPWLRARKDAQGRLITTEIEPPYGGVRFARSDDK